MQFRATSGATSTGNHVLRLPVSRRPSHIHALALADFFEWRRSCWLLLVTWQWALPLLTIDTLTPTVRIHLGLDWWFVRVMWIGTMLPAGVVSYVILFSSMSTRVFDRVLWRGLGQHGYTVEYRLLTTFCSVLMTTMAFWMRLGWHIWRASGDELVVLDGPVTFVNYLRIPKSNSTLEHRVQVRILSAH